MENTLTTHTPQTALAVAARFADAAAARHTFGDYQSRLSQNTRRTQRAALASFAAFLADAGLHVDPEALHTDPEAWRGVSWGLVEAFRAWALASGAAVSTVNLRLTVIRTYVKLAARAGTVSADAAQMVAGVAGYGRTDARHVDAQRDVVRIGHKAAAPVAISPEHAEALKAEAEDTPQGKRDALLMCLLLDHGLRCGEVAGLTVADVDSKRGELRFYRPKVDKRQTHKLTQDTRRALARYMEAFPPSEAPGGLLLNTRRSGAFAPGTMSERAITKRVGVLGQRVGIAGLSAHDCRHHWATSAARGGTDPFALQQAGGWASLAMPRRYVEDSVISNAGVTLL